MQSYDRIENNSNETGVGGETGTISDVESSGAFRRVGFDVRDALRGFPAPCVEAAVRYQSFGRTEDFEAMLPGFIGFHLPRRARPLPRALDESLRLREDLGLDSLALMELAFKLEELFGIEWDPSETLEISTVGQLQERVRRRLL